MPGHFPKTGRLTTSSSDINVVSVKLATASAKKQTQESGTENVGKSLYRLKTAWRQDSFKIDLNVYLNLIRLFILTAVEMYGPTKRILCFPLYVEVIFMPIRRLY